MALITTDDISGMVGYWLNTPMHSKLGSDFGNNAKTLVSQPYNEGIADDFIKKMTADLPILQTLPSGAINVYAIPRDYDKLDLFVDIAGQSFEIPQA